MGLLCAILILVTLTFSSMISAIHALTPFQSHSPSHDLSTTESSSPPEPEAISVVELPLPPAINANVELCNATFNPRGTGCINQTTSLQSGSFTAGGNHVIAYVNFVGALNSSDVYSGDQIILVKTDGALFENGDSWKCLTCGAISIDDNLSYPQAFKDGKRLLAGTNIISCGEFDLVDVRCTPEHIEMYAIRWNVDTNNGGSSGPMRELRIHPDDVHLAWSSFTSGGEGQLGYMGRLSFNPNPMEGEPLTPRYDLTHVSVLFNQNNPPPLSISSE